jgi:hypothetical protein
MSAGRPVSAEVAASRFMSSGDTLPSYLQAAGGGVLVRPRGMSG